MPDAAFPPIAELLPHRGRAILLGRVLAHDAKTTVCSVDPGAGALLRDADGRMPAYVGLEYMAQAVAAHGALLDRDRGTVQDLSAAADGIARPVAADAAVLPVDAARPEVRGPRPGFFVGTRRLTIAIDAFDAGQALEVTATHVRGTSGLLAFDCAVRAADGGEPMVSGVLTVYLLESFEALIEGFSADD